MRKMIFRLVRFSGLPFLFREVVQRSTVTILLFHDINRETARQTFAYLSRKYNVIRLVDYIKARSGDKSIVIPPKALIITFDDGHIGNYDILPEFKRYNIPATIFLCAAIVNTNRHYWYKVGHPLISNSDLKKVSNSERLALLREAGFCQEKYYDGPQALTKEHIFRMKEVVEFQSHTLFHPCLPRCCDEEANEEIASSKKILEEDLGLRVYAIAFPYGLYSERDIEYAKEAGYDCAVTVDYGFNTFETDLYRLKRLSVNDADSMDELIVKASGVWAFLRMIWKRFAPAKVSQRLLRRFA